MAKSPAIAVLGAGMQGTTIALELARRGCSVDLFDRGEQPITRAGLQNEGKLHLGFVYANDASPRTTYRLAAGSLRFLPLIQRWTGPEIAKVRLSSPFLYAVPRDSMLPPPAVEAHFRRVEQCVQQLTKPGDVQHSEIAYPGLAGESLYRPLPDALRDHWFSPDCIAAAFETTEVAVDPVSVAAILRRALARTSLVRFFPRAHVETVELRADGYTVAVTPVESGSDRRYDHVVNALWDGRLRIDREMGLVPDRPWLWRFKVGIRISPGDDLPVITSVTFMLGPYGDAVRYVDGRVYVSWYPAGRLGLSADLAPPAAWAEDESGIGGGEKLVSATFDGLSRLYPDIRHLRGAADSRLDIIGGVIFAWGESDIDDPDSELHCRFDIGVTSVGGYHTVNTGKYCMAPALAMDVAHRIAPEPSPLLT